MAEFLPAFEIMMKNEGGYILHQVEGDRGGMTYAGIARNFHPEWDGWAILDSGKDDPKLTDMVRKFYKINYWYRISGDLISKQRIAESLFDFSVNTGIRTAMKLAQMVVGCTPDGNIGPKTLMALHNVSEEEFITKYALSKLTRYVNICKRDPIQKKFMYNWSYRILKGLS